jgi:hypothetical protein
MILTIDDSYNKNEGTNLPMLSRSGKSTINQYLAFNSAKKKSVDVTPQPKSNDDDLDDEDIGLIMG